MTASDWIAIYGAIGGAILGSIFGGFATYAASYVLGKQQRKDALRSAGIKTYLKLAQINSDIGNSYQHVTKSIARADADGRTKMPKWAKVSPQASEARPIVLTADDLLPFAEVGEFKLFGDLVVAGMQHQSICDAENIYARLRRDLNALMPISIISGTVVYSDPKQFSPQAQLLMVELDSLIASQLDMGGKFYRETAEAANSAAEALRKHYNAKLQKFEIPAL